jgi:hypothetical protein
MRLHTVASALAAACLALTGSAASAASVKVKWSAELGPVPGAKTATAPALADVSLGKHGSSLQLFWTGPADGTAGFHISYQTSISLRKDKWSSPGLVAFGKPLTRGRPAASPVGAASSGQVIVAWKNATGPRIWYAVGQERAGGALSWQNVLPIPGTAAAAGPAVYRPLHSNVIVVAWKAASGSALDYVVGSPDAFGDLTWGAIGTIPRAAAAGPPTIAEASTGAHNGQLYAFWQAKGSTGRVDFATAADHGSATLKWGHPHLLPGSVRTDATPSAQAIGPTLGYPLLVVFRDRPGATLSYVTLAANGKVTGPVDVPHFRGTAGTAISPGVLASAESVTHGVRYELVRPCAGC